MVLAVGFVPFKIVVHHITLSFLQVVFSWGIISRFEPVLVSPGSPGFPWVAGNGGFFACFAGNIQPIG